MTHSLQTLHEFINYLNHAHKTIKFTSEISEEEIPYLDTTVYRIPGTNKLGVKLYTKATDTHSYLEYSSEHPTRCKDANPYGQFLRLKRNSTTNEDFENSVLGIKSYYKYRGYPKSLLEDSHIQSQANKTEPLC